MMPAWRNPDTGRAVLVALDHGLHGVPDGLEDPLAVVTSIVDAGADGLLVSPGLAKSIRARSWHQPPALFVTCDYRTGVTWPEDPRTGESYCAIATPEEAERLGAVGVKVVLLFGRDELRVHTKNVACVARCARECERRGLVMMIEPVFWGAQIPASRQNDPDLVRHGVRLAYELGADVVKAPYTGNAESFAALTHETPVPIVILGGPKRATSDEVFADVASAIRAGAAGVALGRNVFQSEDPATVVRRLRELVHR